MKKIFQYVTTLLLLLVIGTSCEEGNDNWRIITEAQTGTYITGDATIYSATATSSQLTTAPLDNAPEGTNVVGIYTWLKASGSFNILNVDAEGNQTVYGRGEVISSTPAETVALSANGEAFKVATDGLYYIAMSMVDKQLTIIPAGFGIIGDATPLQWNGETSMGAASYDEAQASVVFNLEGVTLDKKEMKFRYSGDWGMSIPYQGATVKIHTNMGGTGDAVASISESFSECKGGGQNFKVDKAGIYTVTLKLDLRTGKFSAKAVCTAEDTTTAELPEKMYINGDAFSAGWSWDVAPEMIPVHSHDGMFWGIYYMKANHKMKFNHERSWDTGENFGAENEDPKGFGEYKTGGSNLVVDHEGYYMIIVSCTLSADKKSVNRKVILAEPEINLVGGCAGNWDPLAKAPFTLSADGTYQATTVAAGDLRIYAETGIDGVDWWQSEFVIKEGKIEYRGKGGDQEPRVPIEAGKVVKLDFRNGTGSF